MTALFIVLGIAVVIALLSLDLGWNNMIGSERNDIVFQDRFKQYGAYQIRKGHGVTLGIALGATVLAAGAGFGGPMIFGGNTKRRWIYRQRKLWKCLLRRRQIPRSRHHHHHHHHRRRRHQLWSRLNSLKSK